MIAGCDTYPQVRVQRYDKFSELPNFWCYFLILVHKIDYELNEFS